MYIKRYILVSSIKSAERQIAKKIRSILYSKHPTCEILTRGKKAIILVTIYLEVGQETDTVDKIKNIPGVTKVESYYATQV